MGAYEKLSDADVVTIRVAAIEHGEKSYDLAERFGVDAAYVRRLVRGEQRVAAGGPTRRRVDGRPPRNHYARAYGEVNLDALPDAIAEACEAGLPVVLDVAAPLPVHAQRLMDTLGVEVRLVMGTFVLRDDKLESAIGAEPGEPKYVAHFATCPNADQHRRPR